MGIMDAMAARVSAGEVVEFRPSGASMVPLIRSRQLVRVAPVDAARVEGICTAVDGTPRPRLVGKARST